MLTEVPFREDPTGRSRTNVRRTYIPHSGRRVSLTGKGCGSGVLYLSGWGETRSRIQPSHTDLNARDIVSTASIYHGFPSIRAATMPTNPSTVLELTLLLPLSRPGGATEGNLPLGGSIRTKQLQPDHSAALYHSPSNGKNDAA